MNYLIWSIEHDGWWRPNHNGYTKEISEAGIYSFEEASKICLDANRYRRWDIGEKPNEAMVPIVLGGQVAA